MGLNWIGIIPAAILGFLVGGLWYGPLFGKAWAAARGLGDELKQGANMPMIFGLTFLLNLFSAAVLDHVLSTYGGPGLHLSLLISGGIALGFIVPSMGVNYLFSRMSLKLFLIDAGYWLVIYHLMGLVLFYLR
ncbi:MAG: DUF1761 domain-containing protein [Sphingobium sp.]|nr:DUF1761 domain-containing protein [Sphingobium sp.]